MIAEICQTLFQSIWDFLKGLEYPGLDVSFAGVMIGVLVIRLSIMVFKFLTGFSASGADYGRATDWVHKGQGKYKLHEFVFHHDE